MKHVAVLLAVLPVLLGPPPAPAAELGRISFPVGCAPGARPHFVRGVLALHSFFYDEAADEFRAATRADPRCAMGYWGEALSHDKTLWGVQDLPQSRAALAQAAALRPGLAEKEAAYFGAADALFGAAGEPGSRLGRVQAYAAALRRMHARWPEDDEITTFYALALLAGNDPDHPSLRQRMEAGALALSVLARNPQHPGAAHYAIHAFDDPDHAVLALPAARAYAAIAPEAPHALHMPAHIFVQTGAWHEAAAACDAAWQASLAWVARRGYPRSYADFHSLGWLPPIYAQLGQAGKAEQALRTFGESVAREGAGAPAYAEDALAVARDTGRWEQLEALLAPAEEGLKALDARRAQAPDAPPTAAVTRSLLAAARATAAARRGEVARARALLAEMRAQQALAAKQRRPEAADRLAAEAVEARVAAEIAAAQGRINEAGTALQRAAEREDTLAQTDGAHPAGRSSYERLGELLLAAGQPARAATAFAAALARTPGRSAALLGAARAAEALHDAAGAAEAGRALQANWREADADFPGLSEARRAGSGVWYPAREEK